MEANARLEEMRKKLEEEGQDFKAAIARMQEATSSSLDALHAEKHLLKEALDSTEDKIVDLLQQLNDRNENLEAMRVQARKREQLVSTLQDDLLQKGECNKALCLQREVSALEWVSLCIHGICPLRTKVTKYQAQRDSGSYHKVTFEQQDPCKSF